MSYIPKSPEHAHGFCVETVASRMHFYVGGRYCDDGSGKGRDIMTGQMYVEKLIPYEGVKHLYPLVFIHGGGQTGTNWLNTPDNRQGWASWFLERGYLVYIVDTPSRGRSSSKPGDGGQISMPVQYMEKYFTATKDFNLWPQAKLHSKWPGTGRRGDPIFDSFYASQVTFQRDPRIAEQPNRDALIALLNTIGPSILVTHSQSSPHGFAAADNCPELVKCIVAIEPAGPPFMEAIIGMGPSRPYGITWSPLNYDPPVEDPAKDLQTIEVFCPPERLGIKSYKLQAEPAKKLIKLTNIPILVVTGESGYHAQYDHCTVAYLRQAGVEKVEHLELVKQGIRGNGHMMFMEVNNLEIVEMVEARISSMIGG